MSKNHYCILFMCITILRTVSAFYYTNMDCGPYGFVCESASKLKLCDGRNLFGPGFICPANTICNEESSDVCEDTMNYVDSPLTRTIRCHRSERIADPSVPDCKGYILCIPNKNRFQGIKFKCSGNTVFSGYTRTCTTADRYKCPLHSTTKTPPQIYNNGIREGATSVGSNGQPQVNGHRAIDCKSYKFTLTQDTQPVKATYFCPSRPVNGESSIRCTVFSNHFCITLERDHEDQFIENAGVAYRKPRTYI
ncbi:hypothetical protein KGM_205659 [Danaus plexippus plexippus]|uniref:Uncharacterized protein n=1 Tax=Danaus plexippus plexippus TaxID=278856 RepID=A0A212FNW7_DANPL|nr:hypothetical protein KGM_205659 [Danaus plexippus plexippus]